MRRRADVRDILNLLGAGEAGSGSWAAVLKRRAGLTGPVRDKRPSTLRRSRSRCGTVPATKVAFDDDLGLVAVAAAAGSELLKRRRACRTEGWTMSETYNPTIPIEVGPTSPRMHIGTRPRSIRRRCGPQLTTEP